MPCPPQAVSAPRLSLGALAHFILSSLPSPLFSPKAYATDPSLTVKYSGTLVKMQYEYPPLLREIQDRVEEELGVKFNHVMLNLYEDGDLNFCSPCLGAQEAEADCVKGERAEQRN